MEIKFSNMTLEDLPEVLALEWESFSWPWSGQLFIDELERDFSYILLARDREGLLLGYICFWVLLDEMHILNIAVRKGSRRKGIGSALAVRALGFASSHGAGSATLEVREKNTAAIRLYEKLGFSKAGIRKDYYDSPPDNAVIMWLYDLGQYQGKKP